MRKWMALLLAFALVMSLAVGCTSTDSDDSADGGGDVVEDKGPVVVGSKIDIEGPLLGHMIIKMLESEGFDVTDQTRTGATDVVRNALLAGEIDIYPEYTANALLVFYPDADIDPAVLQNAEQTYEAAAELDLENEDVVWLNPAPANNTWAVAVPAAFAESNDVYTLEDWAAYLNDGGEATVVGSQEFFDSEAAMPAFEAAYGFTLQPDQKVALATGDTAVTAKAAAEGTDGANAAMVYGTDGTIAALDLVVLEDPLGAQPIYQPAPIVRGEIMDMYPEIADILEPVFALLDLETLQSLNAAVAVDGRDAAEVAEEWLMEEGFLE